MALPHNLEVSVEALQEYPVQFFNYDGQEMINEPPSMSDTLTKFAQKIDFDIAESNQITNDSKKESTQSTSTINTDVSWPWESVQKKIKSSLLETCVLLDVLKMARNKDYLTIEPVTNDVVDTRAPLNLVSKKKALSSAGLILHDGTERMKKLHQDQSRSIDFYQELFNMRQKDGWKLRKIGNSIIGDLSYKSAGSRFNGQGTFEVKKSDEEDSKDVSIQSSNKLSQNIPSSILVKIPTELEGFAYIYVSIFKDENKFNFTDIANFSPSIQYKKIDKLPWHTQLEHAQHVIFCKEIFQQLSREAINLKCPLPSVVVGNQILCHLYNDTKLIIALCRTLPIENDSSQNFSENKNDNASISFNRDSYSYVFEHNLHLLLREVHNRNVMIPIPHPITGHIGSTKRRRLAGPLAFGKTELEDSMPTLTLLPNIILQTKHFFLHNKLSKLLDSISKDYDDPQIIIHHGSLGTAHLSMIRMYFVSPFSEMHRSGILFTIENDRIKCTYTTNIIEVDNDENTIRSLIHEQACQHQLVVATMVAKLTSWAVLCHQVSITMRFKDIENVGSRPGIVLIANQCRNRYILITTLPERKCIVSIRKSFYNFESNYLIQGNNSNLKGFDEVNMEKYEYIQPKCFASKLEGLIYDLEKETDML